MVKNPNWTASERLYIEQRPVRSPQQSTHPRFWTDAQDAFLRGHWGKPGWSDEKVANHIGRTVEACRQRAVLIDIRKRDNADFVWTGERVNYLVTNWNKLTAREIAADLGTNKDACHWQARKLGLKKRLGAA